MATSVKVLDIEPPARRFFHHFQSEITALQQQTVQLKDIALAAGERKDTADSCQDGITKLSHEVKDASSYLPSFDQRTYGEAIKAQQEELNKIRENFTPPPRFAFKTSRSNPNAIFRDNAAKLTAQNERSMPGDRFRTSSLQSSISPPLNSSPVPPNTNNASITKDMFSSGISTTNKPPFVNFNDNDKPPKIVHYPVDATDTANNTIKISHQSQKHILLPLTPDRSSKPAILSHLDECAVDLSMDPSKVTPFASLTIKNIKASLLIVGEIGGSTQVSEAEKSVIVITGTGQLRLHHCQGLQIYLRCRSRPIIEDCRDIAFAKLPKRLQRTQLGDRNYDDAQDMWDKVDDFNWLRPEPSPHWRTMALEEQAPDEVWKGITPEGSEWTLNDILKATKVL